MARITASTRNPRSSTNRTGRSDCYAYPTYGSAAGQRQEQILWQSQPHIDVIEGHRDQTIRANNTALVVGAAIAVALLVFTAVCLARVALINATVSVELDSKAVSEQLAENRSTSNVLEVQDTMLSSTARVKSAAGELKMAAPAAVDEIFLNDDVVATNDDGSLSFGESVRRATTALPEE